MIISFFYFPSLVESPHRYEKTSTSFHLYSILETFSHDTFSLIVTDELDNIDVIVNSTNSGNE